MFERFFERKAAESSERFQEFIAAKERYERYRHEQRIDFVRRTPEESDHAREDSELQRAARGYIAAMELSESEGAAADAATARYQLALVRHLQGELAEAERLLQHALQVTSALPQDHSQVISGCDYHLGLIALKDGRREEAVRRLHASRRIDEANHDFHGVLLCDQALAACAEAAADPSAPVTPPEPPPAPDLPAFGPALAETEDSSLEEADPEPLTGPVHYTRREVICVASFSEAANDALLPRLEDLGPAFGRPVTFSRVAVGSPDPSRAVLRKPEPDQHLAATVLILERAGLNDADLYDFVLVCTDRMMREPDFRLFVHLYDVTLDDLREVSEVSPLAQHLLDSTHIDKKPSFDRLRKDLVRFIRCVEYLKPIAQWKHARLLLEQGAGQVANAVILGAGLTALLGFPAWLLKWNVLALSPAVPAAAGALTGLLAVPMQTPLAYALSRGYRTMMAASRESSPMGEWMKTGLAVMLGTLALQKAIRVPTPVPWLLLGLASGVVLDVMRRAGGRAARKLLDLAAVKERVNDSGRTERLKLGLETPVVRYFSCPLLPPGPARVFISYTPSSAEGSRVAAELYRRLKAGGAAPFLDRASIPTGSNWRRSLSENVADCDVFICILDEKSVRREWVAAEVQSTLEARRISGSPEVFFLIHPNVRNQSAQALPIFREVLSLSDAADADRPRFIELTPQAIEALVWGLSPRRYAPPAVLTELFALPIRLALSSLFIVAVLGFLPAFAVALFASLEALAKLPFTQWIVDHRALIPTTLLSAFMLGICARCIITAWCGTGAPEEPQPLTKAALPTIAAAGLVMALIHFLPRASPIVEGWSALIVIAGWMIAEAAAPDAGRGARKRVPAQS
jgi:tetratricopeptide (TPR) repeat protein